MHRKIETYRELVIRLYVLLCVAVSLISALQSIRCDPRIFVMYAVCLCVSFWRLKLYIVMLLITLWLALFSQLHMFSEYHETRYSINSLYSKWMELRVLWLLLPFCILTYPILKSMLLTWLNSDEASEDNK